MNILKKISVINFLATTLFIQLVLTVNIFSQETIKRFEFKKAHVIKEDTTIAAEVKTTTYKDIYIDNYGNNMASYETERREIPMSKTVEETKTVIITDGNVITTYNPETMKGTRVKIKAMNEFAGMSDEEEKQYAEQMGEAMSTEVTDAGTGDIAGVICTIQKAVTDMMGLKTTTTTWFYKKYVMKQVSVGDVLNFNQVTTLFEEDADFDLSLLLVRDEIHITNLELPK
ncbi:MAG: hypothetical protein KJO12_02740 [Ignavibacteria bacterium]|nr:hypothetical protein [Ignavibacteria bacterium]